MKKKLSLLLISLGLLLLFIPFVSQIYSQIYQQLILPIEKPQIENQNNEVNNEVNIEETTVEKATVSLQKVSPMQPPFMINIPKISVEAVVVEGVEESDLRKGPGLYPQGCLPGEEGNTAIAGHRNTYGRWFYDLDKLEAGDKIILSLEERIIEYEVEESFIVKSNDWSVIDPTPYKALTLTTCNLPDAKTKRFIVRAKQIDDFINGH